MHTNLLTSEFYQGMVSFKPETFVAGNNISMMHDVRSRCKEDIKRLHKLLQLKQLGFY